VSDAGDSARDPRSRPADPAGTQPKVDPESLLPARRESLLGEPEVVEADVVEDDAPSLLPARRPAAGSPAPVVPAATTQWTPRFQFLLGALVAIGVAAVAAIVVLVASPRHHPAPQPRWSAWTPTAGDGAGAQQIAQHVAREYHLSDGRQMVEVSVSDLQIQGIPLAVAVRRTAAEGGAIQVFDDGGLIYRLCGLGPDCSIASGKPSQKRHLLLRREALELALYSFRYVGVKSVVVFMPPPVGQKPSQVLFFRRGDVAPELQRPLSASLAPKAPTVSAVKRSPDAPLVDQLTMPKIFTFSLTSANTDNKGYIVLDPFVAPATQGSSGATSTASTG
jgi:hypothetical protein